MCFLFVCLFFVLFLFLSKEVQFSFILKDCLWISVLDWQVFFFLSNFKDILLFSGLHCFLQEVSDNSYHHYPIGDITFYLWLPLRFLVYYCCQKFNYNVPLCGFLCVCPTCLGFLSLLDLWVNTLLQIWKILIIIPWKFVLQPPPPFLGRWLYVY